MAEVGDAWTGLEAVEVTVETVVVNEPRAEYGSYPAHDRPVHHTPGRHACALHAPAAGALCTVSWGCFPESEPVRSRVAHAGLSPQAGARASRDGGDAGPGRDSSVASSYLVTHAAEQEAKMQGGVLPWGGTRW